MKSNYKKLGQFIQQVSIKNSDLRVDNLLGVSITKEFIKSIANTIGTDMTTYKIVKKNQFTYGSITSRNGDKISIALLQDEEAIVSTSYTVFEIIDTNELIPEYLMMWFRREEFDRYARYMSHGSTREAFGWSEMCDVELPIPSIEKQREIVKEYHTIKDKIKLNEQLNQKLEDTAQSIYKEWFVNFEFPDEDGNPYKSNGGKMVYCDELDMEIPKGFNLNKIGDIDLLITDFVANGSFKALAENVKYYETEKDAILIRLTDYHNDFSSNYVYIDQKGFNFLSKSKLEGGEIIISNVGVNVGKTFRCPFLKYKMSLGPNSIMLKSDIFQLYFYLLLKSDIGIKLIENIVEGSAQPKFNKTNFRNSKVLIPREETLDFFNKYVERIFNYIDVLLKEKRDLLELKEVLLSKMATIEG